MAIDTIPPWVRGPDTLGALSSGASAGAAAGRLQHESQFESDRIGMESQRLRQSAAIEQARLSAAAEQTQMEFQAKQKLAEQNQLREDQKLNIETAYKTAALGIAQGRLEETQKAADAKAKQAAYSFQQRQGFHNALSQGVPITDALRQFPGVSSGDINSIVSAEQLPITLRRESRLEKEAADKSTPKPGALSAVQREDLKDLRKEQTDIEKRLGDPIAQRLAPIPPAQSQSMSNRLDTIRQQIESIKRPKPMPLPKDKKDLKEGATYQTRHGIYTWDGKNLNRTNETSGMNDDADRP